ncbi:glycosylhydrolase family 18-6 [Colletotrichum nymphaeae SA-01]|uniref:chitinase n=1 Tax=Colletotrichum nymphaeae SA-01 TaxID=1460502 RepID=A0A135UPX1_9PEZI|nr:glycosylhydrolase family 18-6 [Colletotrichum nymphaeae SA-01]
MHLPWLTAGLMAVGFLAEGASARSRTGLRLPSSPTYSSSEICPERCSVSGPNIGNWSVYPDFKQMQKCKQTMFYRFSLYDPVDDKAANHRIHACSSYGPDFSKLPASTARIPSSDSVDVDFEIGWWQEGFGQATAGLRSLIKQMRNYVDHGHGETDGPLIMFGQSGQATVGLYIGQGLLNQGIGESALKNLHDTLPTLNVSTPSLAMQLCEPGYDSTHIFGLMLLSNGSFSPIQDALKTWDNATCLSFEDSISVSGQVKFTTPLLPSNGTIPTNGTTNSTIAKRVHGTTHSRLHARAECRTVQVESGDSCAALATKCGITGAEFTKINSASDFCATLRPKQHVCCSTGDMPDFSPDKNSDGSCYSYQVKANDNCDDLAAEYSLTRQKLEDFNKKTWGWNGCQLLFTDTIMCLSDGTPPFPAEIANANCGPQKPGTTPPTDGSDIAKLNPCPLNACCNIWGQCGITKDFCIDTNTGAPGTAEPGTYGCISNCGTDVVKGDGTGSIRIGYFEGYGLGRECLFQDAMQIDSSAYTHIHFAFGTLTADFEVEVGDILSAYQFAQFKRINGPKKILSFGGWDFSTFPDTYWIFREAVTPANRLKVATNIANYIKKHNLDGVDIDWEYPGAPDLPGIPPASEDDGPNYLAFLVLLKNLLPGKTVSIAAPSSYWYLKQYPINAIGKVIDYIVYMTYDLHGQWDANNANSQEGCDTGNCLRSQVNLTETKQSLAMITKAGVPGKKVVVGVTSYGRSFKMADPSCWGPDCLYTGDRLNSEAAKGVCTGTAGYIADAEIAEIMSDRRRAGRVVTSFLDASSNSDVLVYDDGEYVAYMSASTKKTRAALYTAWGMGGTTDWATDLQKYHDAPAPAKDWAQFKQLAISGQDPKSDYTRNGNWTDFDCTNIYAMDQLHRDVEELWQGLNADAAWEDVVRIWKETDQPYNDTSFLASVHATLMIEAGADDCGGVLGSDCSTDGCSKSMDGEYSGPAAQLIWNSIITIRKIHATYYDALYKASVGLVAALKDMENTFAPIPPEEDNTWLLLIIDLVTLGTLSAAGPFFNTFLKSLPKFAKSLDNLKDTSMTLIGQSTTIAKDLLPDADGSDWKPDDQDKFSNYMGQVIDGWATVTSLALTKIFDGSSESVSLIGKAIANGNLYPKSVNGTVDATTLLSNIQKSYFAYAIPALWHASSAWAFVIDSGYGCDASNPLDDYLSDETMKATGACYNGKLYYLASPDGDAYECSEGGCVDQKFSAPKGVGKLGDSFGDVTKEDLIKGAVRTYLANGGKNGGGFANVDDEGVQDDLLDVDVTTPGFIRIPVCSAERAFQRWESATRDETKGSTENYPCDVPPGKDYCGLSSFEDQTSGASPSASDCRQIIKNIEGDGGTDWTTQVVGKNQREIAKFGGCSFGVEATKVDGNVEFYVGGQDVIDIINTAIEKFENSDGKVGAKGDMDCNGNSHQQAVKWGIY